MKYVTREDCKRLEARVEMLTELMKKAAITRLELGEPDNTKDEEETQTPSSEENSTN